ncbi:MAG TPA: site-specific DNA-methyltransferase [Candidatus Limnocylindrales bacterium]|nr:site-specific DNA-methyltransferase [Candidatus Limnocylindrales bacterium]
MTPITENTRAVEMWPIDDVHPNPDNPRTHPEHQLAALAASVREFGWVRPLIVDEQKMVLVGHGMLAAARQLRLERVPVLVISHLTAIQKRAYQIADNQLGLTSEWDDKKLAEELARLERELFGMAGIGFSPEELDRILMDLQPEKIAVDEDAVPVAPVEPVTGLGDVWVLGKHRVTCGDSRMADVVDRVLESGFADMTFADLPYGVAYKQRAGNRTGVHEIANDNLGTAFDEFLQAACKQMLRVTRGAVYLCMSSSELHTLHQAFVGAGGYWSTFLIWSKGHFTLGRSDYQRQYEPILYGWPAGQEHHWCGSRQQGDVWEIPKPTASPLHPTMKPVALVERAIRNSSRRSGVVLDTFAGAGATLIACEKSGRSARLVELEPRFVDVMVRRWQEYSGGEAYRESDGQSFARLERQPLSQAA